MHELALAESIVRIASDHAGRRRVTKVWVKCGRLRQVVPAALEFSFELVAAGTVVEGAELELEEVPVEVRCRACGQATRPEAFPLVCTACGGLDVEVVGGEELYVDELELEDDVATKSLATQAGKGGTAYVTRG